MGGEERISLNCTDFNGKGNNILIIIISGSEKLSQ